MANIAVCILVAANSLTRCSQELMDDENNCRVCVVVSFVGSLLGYIICAFFMFVLRPPIFHISFLVASYDFRSVFVKMNGIIIRILDSFPCCIRQSNWYAFCGNLSLKESVMTVPLEFWRSFILFPLYYLNITTYIVESEIQKHWTNYLRTPTVVTAPQLSAYAS